MPIPRPEEKPDLYDDFDCRPDAGYTSPEDSLPEDLRAELAAAREKKIASQGGAPQKSAAE